MSSTNENLYEEFKKYKVSENPIDKWLYFFTSQNRFQDYDEMVLLIRTLNQIKSEPDKNVPYAAVKLEDESYTLKYNPEWLKMASGAAIFMVLAHEGAHILMKDIPRYIRQLTMTAPKYRDIYNEVFGLSADMQNNDLLRKKIDFFERDDWQATSSAVLPKHYGLEGEQAHEMYSQAIMSRLDDIQDKKDEWKDEENIASDEQPPPIPLDDRVEGESDGDENADDDTESAEEAEGDSGEGQPQQPTEQTGSASGNPNNPYNNLEPNRDKMSNLEEMAYDMAQQERDQKHQWDAVQSSAEDAQEDVEDILEDMDGADIEGLIDKLRDEADEIIQNAKDEHKRQSGNIPSSFKNMIDADDAEPLPWQDILYNELQSSLSASVRPNYGSPKQKEYRFHKQIGNDIIRTNKPEPIYPTYVREPELNAAYFFDTSGSVQDWEFADGLNQLRGVMESEHNMKVLVGQADANIGKLDLLSSNDFEEYIEEGLREGYGGTEFKPGLELVQQINNRDIPDKRKEEFPVLDGVRSEIGKIDLVIYHTDGGAVCPDMDLDFEVIWCVPQAEERSRRVYRQLGEDPDIGRVIP